MPKVSRVGKTHGDLPAARTRPTRSTKDSVTWLAPLTSLRSTLSAGTVQALLPSFPQKDLDRNY